MMNTYYAPTWKDHEGHIYFRLAKGDIFESEEAVKATAEEHPEAIAVMAAMGIEQHGVFAFKAENLDDGEIRVEHVPAEHPVLGSVAIIGGPAFTKAFTPTNETRKDLN